MGDRERVEAACEVMHDAYEAAATREGWETQERSRKPWGDVPEANKATMRAAVAALLDSPAMRDLLAEAKADVGDRFASWVRRSRSFWRYVDASEERGCWLWTGSRRGANDLYGGFGGTTAHRVSWAFANGRAPLTEEIIRHICDNPLCVNPDHLEVGSQQQNVDDMVQRGRGHWQRGECRNGHPRTRTNVHVTKAGKRQCLDCSKQYWANRRELRRLARESTAPNPYRETGQADD